MTCTGLHASAANVKHTDRQLGPSLLPHLMRMDGKISWSEKRLSWTDKPPDPLRKPHRLTFNTGSSLPNRFQI